MLNRLSSSTLSTSGRVELGQEAQRLAAQGYKVFPLVAFQRRPAHKGWQLSATCDPNQISRWWRTNPYYNIGILCDELFVVDFDTDRGASPLDSVFDDDDLVNTVMLSTPSGGTHIWFRQPRIGPKLGPTQNVVAPHIDTMGTIRSFAPAAPSIRRVEGGRHAQYRYLAGHSPDDVPFASLAEPPRWLVDKLQARERAAERARQAQRSAFHADMTPDIEQVRDALTFIPAQGDYEDHWVAILMAVHSAFPNETGIALCEEWSPGRRGEVAEKFRSFRTGGGIGLGTLFHMAKQHGYRPPTRARVPAHTDAPTQEKTRDVLAGFKAWVASEECVSLLKGSGISRPAKSISLLVHLANLGLDRGTTRIYISLRDLASFMSTSHMSIKRTLDKFQETGLLIVESSEKGTVVTLDPLVGESVTHNTILPGEKSVTLSPNNDEAASFIALHQGDDAFTAYPYAYAVKRRGGISPLMTSLGENGLLLWTRIARGGTVADLAEASGISPDGVRRTLRRFASCGLLVEERVGREKWYSLVEGAEEQLSGIRPHMVTAGVGLMRVGRGHNQTANYAAYRLRQRKQMEPRDVLWWENLRDRHDELASICFDLLDEQGFDARLRVGKERPVRVRRRYDHGEAWRTWGRRLYDNYRALDGLDPEEKIRRLSLAEAGEKWVSMDAEQARSLMKEMRERVEIMLRMAPKRARYEIYQADLEEVPTTTTEPGYAQLELEMTL